MHCEGVEGIFFLGFNCAQSIHRPLEELGIQKGNIITHLHFKFDSENIGEIGKMEREEGGLESKT